jgi:hypothetical protein
MKFENHEIWQDIMIWYVEVVEKNWVCFEDLDMYAV